MSLVSNVRNVSIVAAREKLLRGLRVKMGMHEA